MLSGVSALLLRRARRFELSWLTRLAVCAGSLALATSLCWLARPHIALPTPFTFYVPAIILTTVICGRFWGYVTVAVSLALTVYAWVPPQMSFRVKLADLTDVLVWAIVSIFIVSILAALDKAFVVQAEQAKALGESEAKLRAYAFNLEQLVSERTAKLTDAINDLQAFAYTVSHDLRSPLRAVQGFSHLALEEPHSILALRTQDYLRRIDQAAQKMDGLIHDLLLFNQAGRIDNGTESIDPAALVDETVQRHPEWAERGASITVQRPMLSVRGDRILLGQCVAIVLDNAVIFAAKNQQPFIRVWTEHHGPRVRIVVQDNGIGMPSEFLTHIFKPFHRGHPDAGYEGRGIGLAIAKKDMLRMSGDIGVGSTSADGSTFWLELPAGSA
jgi:signal transduction histidine kinase